jgi:hypothetical protein
MLRPGDRVINIAFTVPISMVKRLEVEAERIGVNKSEMLRIMLTSYFNSKVYYSSLNESNRKPAEIY